MFQQSCTADLNNVPLAVARVIQHLSRLVPGKMDRNAFFQILSRQLRLLFNYDRFCINLYDAEREFLNLFTAADGTAQKVDFMHRTESGSYRKGDGYTAAPRYLRYGRMVFALPDEGVTPESLLQRQGFLAELTGDYNAAELVWSVPKFDVKSSTELNEVLQGLGVTEAFDMTKADFTPLTDNGAFLSSAMQAARVKIDEEGVEAAAYTELVCADSAMMEVPPTVEMELGTPFLCVIFENNNVPLFVGTVNTMA